MKKTIIILIFILSLPLAYALYSGESKVIFSIEKCLNITINVNASRYIDNGEFSFLNCSEINRSYWFCDCSDNFDLVLTTKPKTINNYTFNIFYYNYSEVIEEQISSDNGGGGGGGGGSSRSSRTKVCTPYWKCTEWTDCQPNSRATRECNDLNECNATKPSEERYCYYYVPKIISVEAQEEEETTPIEAPQEEETKPTEQPEPQEEKKGIAFMWWVLIGVFIMMVIMIIVFVVKSMERQ